MDTRADADFTRAARTARVNLARPGRVTRRQRAGLITLLVVAVLHVWLLLQWAGLSAAGWARAWPVAPAHHAVMQVASVQSMAAADRSVAAKPITPTEPAPNRSVLRAPTRSVEALAAVTPVVAVPMAAVPVVAVPVVAVPMAAVPGQARSAPRSDESIDESITEPTASRGAEGSLPSTPLPLYATRMPAPTRLRYAVQIGQRKGQADLDWQHDGQHYHLQLDAVAPGGPAWQQTSSGAFDAAGLAPQRFVDRRGRRAERAANFQRETGRISFSGPTVEYPLLDGAQDRLGFIVQLAAIASAASASSASSAAGQVPAQVALFVVDARGLGDVWNFVNQGAASVDGPLGALPSVYLLREAQRLNDWRVEAWLDPQRGFWPARLRMTVARTGAVFELTLAQEPQSP